ncbi:ArsR/SmtB family transcription factor [Alkaliphilus crotonatoxidans]
MDLLQGVKALGDETRLRILAILLERELCVCEIEEILEITQSNASRHLIKLTNAKLLDNFKQTKYVYYQLNQKTLKEYPFITEVIKTAIVNLEICQKDHKRLMRYLDSKLNCDDLRDGKKF